MIQTALKLDELFPNGTTVAWRQVLNKDNYKLYPIGIVASGMFDNTLIIFSKSIDDIGFSIPMLRDIIKLIKSHDYVAVETTRVEELKGIMLKLNMTYNPSVGCYVKG